MSSLQSSDYIAIASAVVALCALAISIWQAYLSRHHNILSVKPHLEIVLRQKADPVFAIDLVNNGLGPAIIDRLVVSKGAISHTLTTIAEYDDLCHELVGQNGKVSVEYFVPDSSNSVGAGSSIRVLSITPSDSDAKINEECRAVLAEVVHRIEATVTYRCIYGVRYESKSRKGRPNPSFQRTASGSR